MVADIGIMLYEHRFDQQEEPYHVWCQETWRHKGTGSLAHIMNKGITLEVGGKNYVALDIKGLKTLLKDLFDNV